MSWGRRAWALSLSRHRAVPGRDLHDNHISLQETRENSDYVWDSLGWMVIVQLHAVGMGLVTDACTFRELGELNCHPLWEAALHLGLELRGRNFSPCIGVDIDGSCCHRMNTV